MKKKQSNDCVCNLCLGCEVVREQVWFSSCDRSSKRNGLIDSMDIISMTELISYMHDL